MMKTKVKHMRNPASALRELSRFKLSEVRGGAVKVDAPQGFAQALNRGSFPPSMPRPCKGAMAQWLEQAWREVT
jgi:hypothetical protein